MFRFSRYKKWFLLASCCGNGALLFSFKYLGFFQDIAIQLCELMGRPIYLEPLELILPVGISFYTLQTLSYTIDVYRGNIPHEPSILRFGCYVAFFPQLVAGPIERASHLLPQFKNLPAFNWISLSDGARRVLWGLFKKVVIADRIAPHVQWILLEHSSPNPAAVFWAGILGNVLIYADFSAYSDIAIGSARMLGIHIKDNFKFPLFATTMPDFWKRWHISLHQFFIDYVYYPLGGRRVSGPRWILNIAIIFLISGLWHGAAWNFIVWSIYHMGLVFLHLLVAKLWKVMNWKLWSGTIWTPFKIALVHIQRGLSMILFFVPDVSRGLNLLGSVFTQPWDLRFSTVLHYPVLINLLILGGFFFLMLVEAIHQKWPLSRAIQEWPRPLRWTCYQGMMLVIMIFGVEANNPFIYFQF
jgi:D-alanyl-lipoteichoic acid acyltransferase DltB (MBOAT superfamily)